MRAAGESRPIETNDFLKSFNSIVYSCVLILYSCYGFHDKHLVGNYYIVEVDSKDDRDLGYKVDSDGYLGLTGGQVVEVRMFDRHLIAKCHVYADHDSLENIRYYIIPIYGKHTLDPTAGVIGPLENMQLIRTLEAKQMDLKHFKTIYPR